VNRRRREREPDAPVEPSAPTEPRASEPADRPQADREHDNPTPAAADPADLQDTRRLTASKLYFVAGDDSDDPASPAPPAGAPATSDSLHRLGFAPDAPSQPHGKPVETGQGCSPSEPAEPVDAEPVVPTPVPSPPGSSRAKAKVSSAPPAPPADPGRATDAKAPAKPSGERLTYAQPAAPETRKIGRPRRRWLPLRRPVLLASAAGLLVGVGLTVAVLVLLAHRPTPQQVAASQAPASPSSPDRVDLPSWFTYTPKRLTDQQRFARRFAPSRPPSASPGGVPLPRTPSRRIAVLPVDRATPGQVDELLDPARRPPDRPTAVDWGRLGEAADPLRASPVQVTSAAPGSRLRWARAGESTATRTPADRAHCLLSNPIASRPEVRYREASLPPGRPVKAARSVAEARPAEPRVAPAPRADRPSLADSPWMQAAVVPRQRASSAKAGRRPTPGGRWSDRWIPPADDTPRWQPRSSGPADPPAVRVNLVPPATGTAPPAPAPIAQSPAGPTARRPDAPRGSRPTPALRREALAVAPPEVRRPAEMPPPDPLNVQPPRVDRPSRLTGQGQIVSVTFDPAGRKVAFLNRRGQVGLWNPRRGRLSWRMSITDRPLRPGPARVDRWEGACVFGQSERPTVYAAYQTTQNVIHRMSDSGGDLSRLVAGFRRPAHPPLWRAALRRLQARDVALGPGMDRDTLRACLLRAREVFASDQEHFMDQLEDFGAFAKEGPAAEACVEAVLDTAHLRSKELIFRNAKLGRHLAAGRWPVPGSRMMGLASVRFRGMPALVTHDKTVTQLNVFAANDGRLLWFFDAIHPADVPASRRFVESQAIEGLVYHREYAADSRVWADNRGDELWLYVAGRGDRSYPGPVRDWIVAGRVTPGGNVVWHSFQTARTLALTASGQRVLAVYESGQAVLWDLSGQDGRPRAVVRQQLFEEFDDGQALAVLGGPQAMVACQDVYWTLEGETFSAPRKARGQITAADIGRKHLLYGTRGGTVVMHPLLATDATVHSSTASSTNTVAHAPTPR
jgi:hypothetical protein